MHVFILVKKYIHVEHQLLPLRVIFLQNVSVEQHCSDGLLGMAH